MQRYSDSELRDLFRKTVKRLQSEGKEIKDISLIMEIEPDMVLDLLGED